LRTGMRANQIARKMDEIVEFSGCARYIDTPVHPGGLGSRSGDCRRQPER
jgi:ABC-type polysaccharide/polyol phosphate transport system ATPase subunit